MRGGVDSEMREGWCERRGGVESVDGEKKGVRKKNVVRGC